MQVFNIKLHANLSNESRSDTLQTDRCKNVKQIGVSATKPKRIKITSDIQEGRLTRQDFGCA